MSAAHEPPRRKSETPQTSDARALWLGDIRGPLTRWSINILVVEDDEADTSLILNALKRHEDVAAAHAINKPSVALELLNSRSLQPDLILVDINMPKIDGFAFVERLRRIPWMAETPVAFLTSSRVASNVEAARDISVAHYVVKPDTFADLQARLDVVIKRIKSGAWSSK